jgi:hypothetical protein
MEFQKTGFWLKELTKIIGSQEAIIAFLLDIQNEWRIKRALSEDPNDQLLIGTRNIDEIITRIWNLEEFRQQYLEEKRKQKEQEQ